MLVTKKARSIPLACVLGNASFYLWNNLWYQMLNHYLGAHGGSPSLYSGYTFYSSGIIAGLFCVALVFGIWPDFLEKGILIPKVALCGLFLVSFLLLFIPTSAFPSLCLFAGLCSGVFLFFPQYLLYKEIPFGSRGKLLASGIGGGLLIAAALSSILSLPGVPDFTVNILAAIFLFPAGVAFWKLSGFSSRAISVRPDNVSEALRFFMLLGFFLLSIAACYAFCLSFQDSVSAIRWFPQEEMFVNYLYFQAAGIIAAGFLYDRLNGSTPFFASVMVVLFGLVGILYLQGQSSRPLFIAFLVVQIGYGGLETAMKLIFLDSTRDIRAAPVLFSFAYAMTYLLKPSNFLEPILREYGALPVVATGILLSNVFLIIAGYVYRSIRKRYIMQLAPLEAGAVSVNTEEVGAELHIPQSEQEKKIGPLSYVQPPDVSALAQQYALTGREEQVLELILRGMTVTEMSQSLFISEVTVKTHVGRILKKTGTKNRTQLLSFLMNGKQDEVCIKASNQY